MKLGDKQRMFTWMISQLINYIYMNEYQATFEDAYRDPRLFGAIGEDLGYGRLRSNHKIRLAIDLNLFKDGKYLTETSDHEKFGIFWESIGGSWGGRFKDGNHYSLEHEGRR